MQQPLLRSHQSFYALGHDVEISTEIGKLITPLALCRADARRQIACRKLLRRRSQFDNGRAEIFGKQVAENARGYEHGYELRPPHARPEGQSYSRGPGSPARYDE